jgi:hypothetical protein
MLYYAALCQLTPVGQKFTKVDKTTLGVELQQQWQQQMPRPNLKWSANRLITTSGLQRAKSNSCTSHTHRRSDQYRTEFEIRHLWCLVCFSEERSAAADAELNALSPNDRVLRFRAMSRAILQAHRYISASQIDAFFCCSIYLS